MRRPPVGRGRPRLHRRVPPYEHVANGSALARASTPRFGPRRRIRLGIDSLRLDSTSPVSSGSAAFYAAAKNPTTRRRHDLHPRAARDGRRWLILAHQSASSGIPPNKVTDPMPDLSDLYDETGAAASKDPS